MIHIVCDFPPCDAPTLLHGIQVRRIGRQWRQDHSIPYVLVLFSTGLCLHEANCLLVPWGVVQHEIKRSCPVAGTIYPLYGTLFLPGADFTFGFEPLENHLHVTEVVTWKCASSWNTTMAKGSSVSSVIFF